MVTGLSDVNYRANNYLKNEIIYIGEILNRCVNLPLMIKTIKKSLQIQAFLNI